MNAQKYYESHIKCDFLGYLRTTRRINPRTLVASEYVLGATGRRADLALYNGSRFIGVEVKSQHDTLTRLQDQLKVYKACFDEVMIVLDERHIEEGLKLASGEVAVFEAGRKGDIVLRRAALAITQPSPEVRLQLLTLLELKKLIGHPLGAPSKRSLLLEQAGKLPGDSIRDAVVEAFQQTFSGTSGEFWHHVKRRRVTLEALNCLSRFATERVNLRERRDEKVRFWDAWKQNAFSALQEAAA